MKPCSECGSFEPRYPRSGVCKSCKKARSARWAAENKERRKEIVAKYDRANQSLRNSIEARRRAIAKSATPEWLTDEHKADIQKIYRYAQSLGYHVDHIVPLKGKDVCGLHVPWNLQVLTPTDNRRKNNKHEV